MNIVLQFFKEAKLEVVKQRTLLKNQRRTIVLLHDEKGFTFREISMWFSERNIEVDHNEVYREYVRKSNGGKL